ncbi:MAG: hypothetical protein CVV27_17270, partial [Candidatus Melainabacteria bacterium HGW-Melainabacteria-1]
MPAEVHAYHAHLAAAQAAAGSNPLEALTQLWQAFDFYLEPAPLRLACQLLSPWPELAARLRHLTELIYPDQALDSPEPFGLSQAEPPEQVSAPQAEPAQLLPWRNLLWPSRRPSLSVCMIVRNEAPVLATALASIREIADEIIVVDTGSSDETMAIAAAEPKVRLSQLPWRNDFATARNASLDLASGDWILVLDADEELLPTGRQALRELLAYPPLGWQVYICPIEQLLSNGGLFYSWGTRLFRRDAALRFSGALHEMPVKWSWPQWLLAVPVPARLRHSGNLPINYVRQHKSKRAEQLRRLVEDPATYTPFLAYHYAHLL